MSQHHGHRPFFVLIDFFPTTGLYRDGKEYEAQHVMVTPAIGYLKKNLNIFSPPLPVELQHVS